MFCPPIAHQGGDGAKGFAVVGQGVFDFGGYFGVNLAVDNAVFFEFAKLLGEHAFAYAGDFLAKLCKAMRSFVGKVIEDHHLPFSADDFERGLYGAGRGKAFLVGWLLYTYFHVSTPLCNAYLADR